jgi:hypothetical protein
MAYARGNRERERGLAIGRERQSGHLLIVSYRYFSYNVIYTAFLPILHHNHTGRQAINIPLEQAHMTRIER